MLENYAEHLVKRLQQETHLFPLLKDDRMIVKFYSNKEQVYLYLGANEINYTKEIRDEKVDISIYGKEPELKKLLEGQMKLQSMDKRNELEVKGKFQYLLRLESILYCYG